MRLSQILKPEFISDNLQAKTKTEVLDELSEMIVKGFPKLDKSKIIDVLQKREKLGSTGIGNGIAIPHGKIGAIEDLVVAFGRSKNGVAFDSMDGKPAHLFFLLLAPEDSSGPHLKALAQISKMLKANNFRKNLMEAKSKNDLYNIIIEQDETCTL